MENTPTSSSPNENGGQSSEPSGQSGQSWQQYPPPGYGEPGYTQNPYGQPSGAATPPPPPGSYPPPGYPPYPGQGYQGYPPPGGQQGPLGPYGAYPPPAGQSFGFQAMLQRWRAVLTQPGVATFDAQQEGASWQTILISLLILGVVRAVTGFISGLAARGAAVYLPPGSVPPYGSAFLNAAASANPISNAIGGLLGAFIGFFVVSGILYLSAKIFGGVGSFLMQSWLLALIFVPIGMVSAIVGLVPLLGGLAALALGIYEIVLAVFAIASAHRVPTDRAVAVVLVPLAVVIVVFCALAIFALGLLLIIARNLGM